MKYPDDANDDALRRMEAKEPMSLHEIEAYVRNYDKKTYEVFAQHGAEPTTADVTAFETQIGFRFPQEFREFAVHPLGGL